MRNRKRRTTAHVQDLQAALHKMVEICICDLQGHCECISVSRATADKLRSGGINVDLKPTIPTPAVLTPLPG